MRAPLALGLTLALGTLAAALQAGRERAQPDACARPEEGGLHLAHDLGRGRTLCARADPGVELRERDGSLGAIPAGRSLTLEVRFGASSRWLEIAAEGDELRRDWRVDGEARPFDDGAREWLADALAAVAALESLRAIRSERARLLAQLEEVTGEERRLRDEIGALLSERGALQREAGAIRSRERSLREDIGDVRGEESALRVEAGAQRVAITSLSAQLETAETSLRHELEAELVRRRETLAGLERRLTEADHAGRVADLERRLGELATAERVAAVEERIEALRVDARVAELEQRIGELQSRERSAVLQRRLKELDAEQRLAGLRERLAPLRERLAESVGGS